MSVKGSVRLYNKNAGRTNYLIDVITATVTQLALVQKCGIQVTYSSRGFKLYRQHNNSSSIPELLGLEKRSVLQNRDLNPLDLRASNYEEPTKEINLSSLNLTIPELCDVVNKTISE